MTEAIGYVILGLIVVAVAIPVVLGLGFVLLAFLSPIALIIRKTRPPE